MNKKSIKLILAMTILTVILSVFTTHNVYQILSLFGILTFVLVSSSFLQANQEHFYKELNVIKDKISQAETPEDLLELRAKLVNHSKKAYNTHAKYKAESVYFYLNSRLKHDFKEKV